VFWVISVYFNIRNTLPKSGTFVLGHPVYVTYISLTDSPISSMAVNQLVVSVVSDKRPDIHLSDETMP